MSQVSPLCATRFALELQQHPNRALVSEVLQGLFQGFRLGFNPGFSLQSAKKNKASAYQYPEIVDAYLANEVALGRVAGPFPAPPLPNLHINSFGVIPKKGQPNKWRLILDMSSPLGSSVNEGINPTDYPLQYIRVDDIIKMVSKFGQGALMAKFDVESAYRNLAVHPSDRYLIGMKWRSMFYVDLALPFGLRSAPYIFNSVAELVEWILLINYHLPDLLHYLDDFITAGPPNSPQCKLNLSTASSVCAALGLPLHPSKKVGPTTCMVTLGIELDSVNQLARLPNDKLTSLLNLLHRWSTYRWCTKRQLQCTQSGRLHPNGSPCPASEWTLCLFATHLSGSLSSASIKIYLSAVRSMHIDLGFPDSLVDCLQLQRLLRGIKRTQGSPGSSRLPITDHHMMIIHNSLSFANPDHVMFWAASTLAYFGFLRSAEFTVPCQPSA